MSVMSITAISDPELRRFLQLRLDRIQQLYAPSRLIFFGSRSTGTATEWSDIDLILVSVQFQGKRFLDRLADFARQMAWERGIDALCYTPEEFVNKLQGPTLVREAVAHGIEVL